MKKKMVTILLTLCLACTMGACGNSSSASKEEASAQEENEPLDLTGTWTQEGAEDSYQEAAITEDTIEIYWISESESMRSIYWSGTYESPTENTDEFSWTSESNSDKMDSALLSSQDDTKEFAYKDGKISYEVSMMGTTATVNLTQTSKDIPEYFKDSESSNVTVIFENDTLTAEDATIKITGTEVISPNEQYGETQPTLLITYDYTNNSDEPQQPGFIWISYFNATQETESTIEDLDVGSAPLGEKYNAMREMSHTDVKPGATVQSVVAYKINYADHPVTLVASDGIIGDEIGTKIINLQ